MLNPEDFEIPLEMQLKLRVVKDEIDQCTNVDALQEHLKQCAEQLMKYQQILTNVLRAQLAKELGELEESLK